MRENMELKRSIVVVFENGLQMLYDINCCTDYLNIVVELDIGNSDFVRINDDHRVRRSAVVAVHYCENGLENRKFDNLISTHSKTEKVWE